jgi:XisI protein
MTEIFNRIGSDCPGSQVNPRLQSHHGENCPMDKLEKYRSCIQTLLEKHGQSKPRNEDIENELFFDSTHDL